MKDNVSTEVFRQNRLDSLSEIYIDKENITMKDDILDMAKKLKVSEEDIRKLMLSNINALKLPTVCVGKNGAVYPRQLRRSLPIKGNDMNKVMSRICSVRYKDGVYSGLYIKDDGLRSEYIIRLKSNDEEEEPIGIFGLFGSRKVNFSVDTSTGRCRKAFKQYRHSIRISLLIACLDLIRTGYYVKDWSVLGVNHKDNSGSKRHSLAECLLPENLELFSLKDNIINLHHGDLQYEILNRFNIYSRYSLYGGFTDFISYLHKEGKYTLENILKYKHTVEDGIVVFD